MIKSLFCTIFVLLIATGFVFTTKSFANPREAKDGTTFTTMSNGDTKIKHPGKDPIIIDHKTGHKKTGTSI